MLGAEAFCGSARLDHYQPEWRVLPTEYLLTRDLHLELRLGEKKEANLSLTRTNRWLCSFAYSATRPEKNRELKA